MHRDGESRFFEEIINLLRKHLGDTSLQSLGLVLQVSLPPKSLP